MLGRSLPNAARFIFPQITLGLSVLNSFHIVFTIRDWHDWHGCVGGAQFSAESGGGERSLLASNHHLFIVVNPPPLPPSAVEHR